MNISAQKFLTPSFNPMEVLKRFASCPKVQFASAVMLLVYIAAPDSLVKQMMAFGFSGIVFATAFIVIAYGTLYQICGARKGK